MLILCGFPRFSCTHLCVYVCACECMSILNFTQLYQLCKSTDFSSFSKSIFSGCNFLYLNMSFHFILASLVSDQKSAIPLIRVFFLYRYCVLPSACLQSFLYIWFQQFEHNTSRSVCVWVCVFIEKDKFQAVDL